jgi:hypothetical protein
MLTRSPDLLHGCRGDLPDSLERRSSKESFERKLQQAILAFSVMAALAAFPAGSRAQSPAISKDIGNYGMLAYMGENISLEFFYNGPHSLLSRMHLNDAHGSPDPGPNH